MRIAVTSEVSARDKNGMILDALKSTGAEIFNIGMSENGSEPELTYIHTGLIAALALSAGAADFVVGGCGTGQGFLLSAMQYPGVFCGLITSPLDAWLFSQINAGNCVSLALNKGFGWAGDINLRYIFDKLFCDKAGQGYPLHRSESQRASRDALTEISAVSHRDMSEIFRSLDADILARVRNHRPFIEFMERYAADSELKSMILSK
ncbi:MAG: RpiB/LacA/LacB family sugar-phosphate isomerase [Oscillospiraceae bacterium]|nr:RpiB/LacA/LacB family sugar-phosphate isomerase [Oscillospiraceae bacterium]